MYDNESVNEKAALESEGVSTEKRKVFVDALPYHGSDGTICPYCGGETKLHDNMVDVKCVDCFRVSLSARIA